MSILCDVCAPKFRGRFEETCKGVIVGKCDLCGHAINNTYEREPHVEHESREGCHFKLTREDMRKYITEELEKALVPYAQAGVPREAVAEHIETFMQDIKMPEHILLKVTFGEAVTIEVAKEDGTMPITPWCNGVYGQVPAVDMDRHVGRDKVDVLRDLDEAIDKAWRNAEHEGLCALDAYRLGNTTLESHLRDGVAEMERQNRLIDARKAIESAPFENQCAALLAEANSLRECSTVPWEHLSNSYVSGLDHAAMKADRDQWKKAFYNQGAELAKLRTEIPDVPSAHFREEERHAQCLRCGGWRYRIRTRQQECAQVECVVCGMRSSYDWLVLAEQCRTVDGGSMPPVTTKDWVELIGKLSPVSLSVQQVCNAVLDAIAAWGRGEPRPENRELSNVEAMRRELPHQRLEGKAAENITIREIPPPNDVRPAPGVVCSAFEIGARVCKRGTTRCGHVYAVHGGSAWVTWDGQGGGALQCALEELALV